MAKKNVRNMKVCGQSGYKYETVPVITLKGKWLEELGFHLGDYVQVKCENGQLIITYDGPGSNDAVIPGNSTGTKNGSSSDTDASK